jgi:hypothetical protein
MDAHFSRDSGPHNPAPAAPAQQAAGQHSKISLQAVASHLQLQQSHDGMSISRTSGLHNHEHPHTEHANEAIKNPRIIRTSRKSQAPCCPSFGFR